MPKHLFEYAVIRVVPRVEREEFINVGVILYCASQKFLGLRYNLDEEKLKAVCKTIDVWELLDRVRGFEKICNGGKDGGPIAQSPIASRFRWLAASRSTIIQMSKIHPGMCADADETLRKLMLQLVL